jgi:hypothetical protein
LAHLAPGRGDSLSILPFERGSAAMNDKIVLIALVVLGIIVLIAAYNVFETIRSG